MLRFLVYHRITDNQRGDFRAIHPDRFRRHLEVIDAAGIPVIDPSKVNIQIEQPDLPPPLDFGPAPGSK